jgi:hypothetical protein
MGDKFDIKFKPLPPDLKMKLWVLALDADTSKVAIAYRPGSFVTSLAYNYGGNLEASFSLNRGFSTKLGVDPSDGDLDLGLVFRGFRFGAKAGFKSKSAGLSFGYGQTLLPFPTELADTFNSAGFGLGSMMRNIEAAPDDPLAWYKLHKNDVKTISKAIDLGQKIDKYGKSKDRFGVGLRLNFAPETGLTIYGGAQVRF